MFNSAFAATLPIAATDVASRWDLLWDFLVYTSVFFFILVVGGMLYLAIHYRHRPGIKTQYITGNHLVEGIWTVIPLVLLMIMFGWGYSVYNGQTRTPTDAYEIRVIGKQWLWTFLYDDGRTSINELYVPVGKPVKLVMTSDDVLHSFFIPNFRVKQDVVPGMYTSVWFEANVPGKHQVFCTEYCGTSHSQMLAKVIVLEPAQWEAWKRGKKIENIPDAADGAGQRIAQKASAPLVSDQIETSEAAPLPLHVQGRQLMAAKGCVACHSADGSKKIGPSFKGAWGHETALADGSKAMVDENYIRESLMNPRAKLVKGYGPVMPTFQGLLTETEVSAMIAYMKSISKQ